ncbi:MAG: BNR repeat-containing protein [Tannerellaceae bacterium]|jgi:hypothetical protein|nr:BNR repeat-containing protein [Tannerellaceae bacterium]
MKNNWIALCIGIGIGLLSVWNSKAFIPDGGESGYTLTEEGAWCWFADPRAIHYENLSGTINKTYVGYIDVHGNIKAMQYDFLTGEKEEVLIRSYFQPDDHNNPTFLILPGDERVMVFYSRHTDESCFYYRVSELPGDITSLGKEYRLETDHPTTYPSPFILSDDPTHIYLCWRGIQWHPTIARLTMPDDEGRSRFDWGPKQMLRYTVDGTHPYRGSRPYAKYTSNGKDKIYMTYTTTHPDNENPNWVYFNYIHIPASGDTSEISLTDVKGETLSRIGKEVHCIQKSPDYLAAHPQAVVDHPDSHRDWVWEVAADGQENPVIALARINETKDSHDYYYAKWTGKAWGLTFLTNAGGSFHQTPGIEACYSGGMSIDKDYPDILYCSVPVDAASGRVYEIKKYTIGKEGSVISTEQITRNSAKNNVRPYVLPGSGKNPLRLVWMHGDYYDWIVSSSRPQGYPTAIHGDYCLPAGPVEPERGWIGSRYPDKVAAEGLSSFSISVSVHLNPDTHGGEMLQLGSVGYGIDKETFRPYVRTGEKYFCSTNKLATSDVWKTRKRATGGEWYEPETFRSFHLAFVCDSGMLTTYINGLIDQKIAIESLELKELKTDESMIRMDDCRIYDRKITQDEIKKIRESSR